MIPPLPIEAYPPNTLEGLIARRFVKTIFEAEAPQIALELVWDVIHRTRDVMSAAGWNPTYQHIFLKQLRNDLTELTEGHPVTRQFIVVLDLELESN